MSKIKRKLFIFVVAVTVLFYGIPQVQAQHRPKDVVTIKASGKVYFNKEGQSGVSPDGWPVKDYSNSWPYNRNYCNDPEPGMNHAALIGDVGQPNVFIGRKLTFSGKNGTLYLGINDCTLKGKYKNSGWFIVNITILRGGIQEHM